MKVAVFSTRSYDRQFIEAANAEGAHAFTYLEERLSAHTAPLANGHEAACLFVNDRADPPALDRLSAQGCRLLALRSAGFNHVDLAHAAALGLTVLRVPAYSPHSVAEHALALILSLNRKIHRAYNRTREGNFALEGLLGREIHGSTAGIVGTGRIGCLLGRTLAAMGCRVLGHDPHVNPDFEALGACYTGLDDLLAAADLVSLHCPLTPETHYLIDDRAVHAMKPGVILINTSRGGLVDTRAVIRGLKSGKIGALGLDVYEQEEELFFENLSETIIQDDHFQRLMTFPNVIITGHQAFFTDTALRNIADTTIANLTAFADGQPLPNQVSAERLRKDGARA